MATDRMKDRFKEIEGLAYAAGLRPFDIQFFEVPSSVIYEVASYGLPVRYSHWSFGKVYQYQKSQGEMGFSKIYELILNNDPSYAFLDTSNTDTINLMICAHCYLPGTYVQTKDGIKIIEDVKHGDLVYSHTGDLCEAAPTYRVVSDEVVTIQSGCYSFTQTFDHKLWAIKTESSDRTKHRSWKNAFEKEDYQPKWIEASSLKPGDFLVVNKPKFRKTAYKFEQKIEIPIKKILHKHVEDTITIPMNEESGELMGLFLAEGYARPKGQMGLCFHSMETDLHQRSVELVDKYFGLKARIKNHDSANSSVVEFNEICIAAYLRNWLGHSCYSKHVPTEWMTADNKEFLRGLLRGFLLGDGDKTSPRHMGFSTTSSLLAIQIQQIAMHLGIYFGIEPRDRSTPEQARQISFTGRASGIYDQRVRFLLNMPKREVSRTWSGIIEDEDRFYVKIQSISVDDYEGLVHCLHVSHDNSFTLANGIVTHNCIGHSDFFANNIMFKEADETAMVKVAKRHAEEIDQYRKDYGDDEIDEWLDVALAMERHIDVYKKLRRARYPKRHIEYKERAIGEWEDLHPNDDPLVNKVLVGTHLPPSPEKDILWFLTEYANLEDWQKRIFEIVRRESYYFYPQYRCVTAGSLVLCPGAGLVRIESLCPKEIGTMPSSISLVGGSGVNDGFKTVDVKTSHVHTMPATKTIEIELDMGITIEGTPEHPVEVSSSDLRIEMKNLSQLELNDHVVVRRNTQVFGCDSNLYSHLSKFETVIVPNHRHKYFSVHSLQRPANWQSLAKIAGYVCSEGNFCNNSIGFSNKDKDVIEDYVETFSALFDLEPSVSKREDGVANITSYNERLYEVLNSLGFGDLKHSSTKEVPWFVLQSSKETQTSFLRAYFEGDGFNNGEKISATSKSKNLINQIQLMLLNMDIFSKIHVDNADYGDFYRIDIRGLDASVFLDVVGFISDKKQDVAVSSQGRVKESEYVPYVLESLNTLRSSAKRGTYYECCDGKMRRLRFGRPSDKGQIRTKEIPRRILDELPEFVSNCKLLDFGFGQKVEALFGMKDAIFQPVSRITPKEEDKLVYDVTVPGDHLFLCNGIINHNTKIMNEGWACLVGNSYVLTSNGYRKFEQVIGDFQDQDNVQVCSGFREEDGSSRFSIENVSDVHTTPPHKTRRIMTDLGISIEGALNHLLFASTNGYVNDVPLEQLGVGDFIVIALGSNVWATDYEQINFTYPQYSRSKPFRIPQVIDEKFAEFLGFFLSGMMKRGVQITNKDENILQRCSSLILDLFGLVAKITPRSEDPQKFDVQLWSSAVINLLEHLGIDLELKSKEKEVPECIMRAPKSVVAAFLRAYFDGDSGCYVANNSIVLSTSSPKMAEQVGLLLLNFGIRYKFRTLKKPGYADNFHIAISRKFYFKKFAEEIGFAVHAAKQKCCERAKTWSVTEDTEDWIYTKIVDIQDGYEILYDMTVPEGNHYVAQGAVNHNSYWHAELMHQYFLGNSNDFGFKEIEHDLTAEEHLDFLASHEKVVQPGMKVPLKVEQDEVDSYGRPTGKKVKTWHPSIVENPNIFYYATRINPYYVGFRMFRDIKDRWDEYHKIGYREDEWGEKIPVTQTGAEKIREVMESEDDVSFFRNYLTEDLCDEFHLFAFGSPEKYRDNYRIQEEIEKRMTENADKALGNFPIDEQLKINKTLQVRTKDLKDIVNSMARTRNNYGAPCIVVRRVDSDGTLRLEHLADDGTNVDIRYGEHVLSYVYRVWGRPVEIVRRETDHTHVMRFDNSGFSLDHSTSDYPQVIEEKDTASSW